MNDSFTDTDSGLLDSVNVYPRKLAPRNSRYAVDRSRSPRRRASDINKQHGETLRSSDDRAMCDSGDECDFDVRLAQFLCKKMNKGMPNVTVAPDNRVNAGSRCKP